MTVAAEELALRIKLLDDASAGTDRIAARVRALGASGAVAAAGLTIAASAAAALGSGVERGAARLVGMIDGLASRALRTGKWIALAGVGFAAWEVKNVVKLHGELGDMEKVIRQVTGSAAKAREMVGMIFTEAGKPGAPAISQLREAVQALTVMGADPSIWLKRMLDTAAGTGQALGEVVTQFRSIWLGGQEASLSYKRFGISPAAFGIGGKDRAADMARLGGALESRYGGLGEQTGGLFGGALGSMRAKVQAFLYDATGPVVGRIEADLKRIDAALGRTLGGSAGQRLGKTIGEMYGAVSARAEEFLLTGQTQGWKLAFGNLWRDIEPEIVRALKWAGGIAATAFWEAFKTVMAGASKGEAWALAALGYGGAKLGAGALVSKSVSTGWDKLFGAAGKVGTTAAGVAGGQAIGNAITQRALLGAGGAAAGPPVEYLLGQGAVGAAGGAAAKGLLVGAASVSAIAAAAVAAIALLGGAAWVQHEYDKNPTGTYNFATKEFDQPWYERAWEFWSEGFIGGHGKGPGLTWLYGEKAAGGQSVAESREQIRAREEGSLAMARGYALRKGGVAGLEGFNKIFADVGDPGPALKQWLDNLKSGLADVVGGLEARIKSFSANQSQIEGLVGASRETLQADYNDLTRKGMSPEDRRKAVLGDVAEISRRISEIDYGRVSAGEQLLETARRHLGLLDEQWTKTKALAAEAEAMRSAEISESRAAIMMGPAEYAQREAVKRAVQTMEPEQFADAWQAGRLKDVLGKYNVGDSVSEAQIGAWRARAGLPGLSEGGGATSGAEKTRQDAERARIEAETKKRTAEETKAVQVQVQVGVIEVALKLEDKDKIVDAVTLAIDKVEKEVKGAIEERLKQFQDEVGRRDK